MSFQFLALPADRFAPLFALSDGELAARNARRMTVTAKPGFPCRVSLDDAEVGETVLLLPFAHHDVASPYRAEGPIFVREGAATASFAPNELPPVIRSRLLSLRAYDRFGMMQRAEVVEGCKVASLIEALFADPAIAYLHAHNAKPGCFSCRVERAA